MIDRNGRQARVLRVLTPDSPAQKGEFKAIGGSRDDGFNELLLNDLFRALWFGHCDEDACNERRRVAVTAMAGIGPRDEAEGMLASLLVAVHSASMECFRRAILPDQPLPNRDANLKHGTKLARLYSDLLLTLDKHRGKGQQRVTVEHVHVHQGGQAIVGTVQAGGGVPSKSEDLPHAKAVTDAASEALPSQVEEVRDAVPVTRG